MAPPAQLGPPDLDGKGPSPRGPACGETVRVQYTTFVWGVQSARNAQSGPWTMDRGPCLSHIVPLWDRLPSSVATLRQETLKPPLDVSIRPSGNHHDARAAMPAPTRPPPNTTMKHLQNDSEFESSDLSHRDASQGEVPAKRAEGVLGIECLMQ